MIVIDANVLIQLTTGKADPDDTARLDGLIERVTKAKTFIGVPTPALAEFLVKADAAADAILRAMERTSSLRVLPFDKKAAYQCALLDRAALKTGSKRGKGNQSQPWQKVKVDRQIVAIAMTNGAEMIVSGDGGLITTAGNAGLTALQVSDLPIPEAARQHNLFVEPHREIDLESPAAPAQATPAAAGDESADRAP